MIINFRKRITSGLRCITETALYGNILSKLIFPREFMNDIIARGLTYTNLRRRIALAIIEKNPDWQNILQAREIIVKSLKMEMPISKLPDAQQICTSNIFMQRNPALRDFLHLKRTVGDVNANSNQTQKADPDQATLKSKKLIISSVEIIIAYVGHTIEQTIDLSIQFEI